uniref:Shugoshin C-terminal domain-containing protein n=1 Tax=Panagrolaimus davidi TaxID=227884 RepID=A0A914NYR4_9BILA
MINGRDYAESVEEESEEEMSGSLKEEPEAVKYSYQDGVGLVKAAAAQKFTEVLDFVVNFSVKPVIAENHRLNGIIVKEREDNNVTVDKYTALLNENQALLEENKYLSNENKSHHRKMDIMISQIHKLRTKTEQLEAEKQTSLSLRGPEPASSSSDSSAKEKTVVEAENADERSKEELSAPGVVSNVEAAIDFTEIFSPRIYFEDASHLLKDNKELQNESVSTVVSNVAAAKKAQLSIKGDKSGSKEEESVSSNQEKIVTPFRLELRSRSSAKRQTGRCRSQEISRGDSKAKEDAPVIIKRSKSGASVKSSRKIGEPCHLRKRRATETFNDASCPKRTRSE